MANNPRVGTKYVSVNLNKSYGQPSNNHIPNSSFHGSNRPRTGSNGSGGSGMVVLSRPRSSQKAGPKLSVPSPLNLPSLRKEHERFDSLGSISGPAGAGISGSGSRSSSSGMGWTRPSSSPSQVAIVEQAGVNEGINSSDAVSIGDRVNASLSSRPVAVAAPNAAQAYPIVEKAAVLRGEDFPSLRATLCSSSVPLQKQKDTSNQKQNEVIGDDLPNEKKDTSGVRSSLDDISSQMHSSHSVINGSISSGSESHGYHVSRISDQARKLEESFPGPLPLVRFNPRSDWADDERDTSHALVERHRESRNPGFPKSEPYLDGDFDVPKVTGLPQKSIRVFDRRDHDDDDDERGIASSNGIPRVDPLARMPSQEGRDGGSWRNFSVHKEQFLVPDTAGGIGGAKLTNVIKEPGRNNKYIPSSLRVNAHEDIGKRDTVYRQGERQPWNNRTESYNNTQGLDQSRYAGEHDNRNRFESIQNNSVPKSSFSSGAKGLPINDPLLNFGREKRFVSKSRDRFSKDFAASDFDGQDLFSGSLVGLVKKKKDLHKQTDFHDPVRESFEAELERVQKMQELERQRIIEEQERALELARREEEERMRLAREQDARQRRLDEEAREAAWRAEQERTEAMHKAEEQRIAREEEKRMMQIEEERRKQAAKQKLLELEEKIARRQAETAKGGSNLVVADEKVSSAAKEKFISGAVEIGDWEDGERMVERITTSASSDSPVLNRALDMSSQLPFSRDMGNNFVDRGKSHYSWRRDIYENGSSLGFNKQDQGLQRDSSARGNSLFQKDYYGGNGFMSSRNHCRGGILEPQMEEFTNLRGRRWNVSVDGDHCSRNAEIDSEIHENYVERFGDAGWVQGHNHGNPYPQYPDRPFHPTADPDAMYTFGRSRFTVRQPRVLPPPAVTSVPKSYRVEDEFPEPSNFLEPEMQYDHAARVKSTTQTGFRSADQEPQVPTDVIVEEQKVDSNTAPSCDWQSSVSVLSLPNSPTHLSHDDLEVSINSPVLSVAGEGKNIDLSSNENKSVLLSPRFGNEGADTQSLAVSTVADDEWTLDDDKQLQQQEDYEDVEGYQEEDDAREGDDDTYLNEQYEDIGEKDLTQIMDNLVLGFDEGVQVGMPSEDIEGDAKSEENTFVAQQTSVVTSVEQIVFADANADAKPSQLVDGSLESKYLNHVKASSAGQTTHYLAPNTINMAQQSSSGQSAVSNAATAMSQPEIPFKLQFGLFSGPSLIPSPVPAIQIGSIQMPLHLHPQVSPSLNNMHPSAPPLFQFGQLRYTSPLSQGMVPVASQMPFCPATIPSGFSSNQNSGSQTNHEISSNGFFTNESKSHMSNHEPGNLDVPQETMSREINSTVLEENTQSASIKPQGEAGTSLNNGANVMSTSGFRTDDHRQKSSIVNDLNSANIVKSASMPRSGPASVQTFLKEKDMVGSKSSSTHANKEKTHVFTVKGSGSRSSAPVPRTNYSEFSGFSRRPWRNIQRTEFRIKESIEKRQPGPVASDPVGLDQKSNLNSRGNGVYARRGPRNVISSKKGAVDLAFGSKGDDVRDRDSESRGERENVKQDLIKSCNTLSGEGNLKRNLHPEDVDAPPQSGVVHVFEQPGIEAPSDEDDFIEVRSKRQMLNVRREQREREIKAKSRAPKVPQRPRSTAESSILFPKTSKSSISSVKATNSSQPKPEFTAAEVHAAAKRNVSSGFATSLVSQPLAPIGTPPLKIESQNDSRTQIVSSIQTSFAMVTGGEKNAGLGSTIESRSKVPDVKATLGSWGNLQFHPQICEYLKQSSSQIIGSIQTESQSDEKTKTQKFDSHSSDGNQSSGLAESGLPLSSILANDKPFSSASSPINSLLAGEKIQFGAVTSPTVLIPNGHSLSHGIGLPGLARSEMQISCNNSAPDNDCGLFYEKEKHSNECNMGDCEAEAEAAASAVAVAAISSDDIVGNGLGTCSVSASDTKTFVGADITGLSRGVSGNQLSATQSRAEERFIVSLPADLCVDTPPMSLWPPIPSPQSSSTPMLSHFHSGPTSHFPFYEMNPLLGGRIFTFGPHEDSSSPAQSQSQKTNVSASGPVGNWQQCQSNVDSFYGPPAGFTGPFISPPGGIPAVQGPPHMVVYNHFAPVGQFGHVGLSFLGTTYIPSGKQPDWKHNPSSSAMITNDGNLNNLNSSHRNPSNMSSSMQHLAPGSPLIPMTSPLAMYDGSSFQSPSEMSVQARCPHFGSTPVQTIPASMPLQQAAALNNSPFSRGPSVDQSICVNRFHGSQTPVPSNNICSYSTAPDVHVTQLPDELGIVDSSATGSNALTDKNSSSNTSLGNASDGCKADQNVINHDAVVHNSASPLENQSFQPKNTSMQQHSHSSGYNSYQRAAGIPQKNGSGADWSHRRIGFQGRNQSMNSVKSFSSTKMKQVYVAKQSTSGASTVS